MIEFLLRGFQSGKDLAEALSDRLALGPGYTRCCGGCETAGTCLTIAYLGEEIFAYFRRLGGVGDDRF